ncbi:protein FAR1-RELATED SEQUENCE 5-like isoform X2 [Tripterygium wilfordii]|uniref:protein FAR1-RELATED SEQUENCE 5-like isoform X2 n=1 Tax=Tripterygium wilfordii TaxID=458696 RepID=UPI0018F85EC2|nr:protein FAR1-RELATED SEQUENCE 5-like isoform X2 [Tripterygium wilfordii]
MSFDVEAVAVKTSAERDLAEHEEGPVTEPCVGMEFESEEAAKEFYDEYAKRAGFIMRTDQCRRSEVDGRILSRRLSCNKQGFYVKTRDEYGPVRKPRPSTREGCKAMILVKVDKSGKWVVTRLVKEHTHTLIASSHPSWSSLDFKDRRIQDPSMELERQDQLCELYRELLIRLLENVEEQTELLSTKIEAAVNNVREFETKVEERKEHR